MTFVPAAASWRAYSAPKPAEAPVINAVLKVIWDIGFLRPLVYGNGGPISIDIAPFPRDNKGNGHHPLPLLPRHHRRERQVLQQLRHSAPLPRGRRGRRGDPGREDRRRR